MPAGAVLGRLRHNPAGDWTIRDIERVCRRAGVRCTPPSGGGSHYRISHPSQAEIITIPARRPIKPVYIRRFVAFLDRVGGGDATH
jgi:hypothetical protein